MNVNIVNQNGGLFWRWGLQVYRCFFHDRDSETPFYSFEVENQNKDEEPDIDLDIIVGNSDFYGDMIVILMCFAVVCQV